MIVRTSSTTGPRVIWSILLFFATLGPLFGQDIPKGLVVFTNTAGLGPEVAVATECTQIDEFPQVVNIRTPGAASQRRLMRGQVLEIVRYPDFSGTISTDAQFSAIRADAARLAGMLVKYPRAKAELQAAKNRFDVALQQIEGGKVLIAGTWVPKPSPVAAAPDTIPELTIVDATGSSKSYHLVRLGKVEGENVQITHASGSATVPVKALPQSLRDRLGINPTVAVPVAQKDTPRAAVPVSQTEWNRLHEQKARLESQLVEARSDLAKTDSRIASERQRWQQSLEVINTLTRNKTVPVREGSPEYQRCAAASQVIKDVEAGAARLTEERAGLAARVKTIEDLLTKQVDAISGVVLAEQKSTPVPAMPSSSEGPKTQDSSITLQKEALASRSLNPVATFLKASLPNQSTKVFPESATSLGLLSDLVSSLGQPFQGGGQELAERGDMKALLIQSEKSAGGSGSQEDWAVLVTANQAGGFVHLQFVADLADEGETIRKSNALVRLHQCLGSIDPAASSWLPTAIASSRFVRLQRAQSNKAAPGVRFDRDINGRTYTFDMTGPSLSDDGSYRTRFSVEVQASSSSSGN